MDFSELQKLQEELDQKKAHKTALPQEKTEKYPEIRKFRNQDAPKTRFFEIPKTRKEDTPKWGNQEIQTSGKPEIPKTGKPPSLKVPKYYTQLPLEWQEEIKIYAIRHKLADYEVVIQAIEAFFQKKSSEKSRNPENLISGYPDRQKS